MRQRRGGITARMGHFNLLRVTQRSEFDPFLVTVFSSVSIRTTLGFSHLTFSPCGLDLLLQVVGTQMLVEVEKVVYRNCTGKAFSEERILPPEQSSAVDSA